MSSGTCLRLVKSNTDPLGAIASWWQQEREKHRKFWWWWDVGVWRVWLSVVVSVKPCALVATVLHRITVSVSEHSGGLCSQANCFISWCCCSHNYKWVSYSVRDGIPFKGNALSLVIHILWDHTSGSMSPVTWDDNVQSDLIYWLSIGSRVGPIREIWENLLVEWQRNNWVKNACMNGCKTGIACSSN